MSATPPSIAAVDGLTLPEISACVVGCRACPRLVPYVAEVGRVKRRAYRQETYWARPVPAFGDPHARVALIGLAPGAHGSNRTGRMFTGDASGEWLYRALHRAGFASQPIATGLDDGLTLQDAIITAAVRCAPPDNKPTPDERSRCLPFLEAELAALRELAVFITLGKLADDTIHAYIRRTGSYLTPRARFAHGAETEVALADGRRCTILASYHPSRQNTNTGVLTAPMLDAIFTRARQLITTKHNA